MAPAMAFAQTTVYSNNFESNTLGAEWSGAGAIEGTGGLSAFGFGNLHLRNAGQSATVLSLGGLAAHSTVTLEFSLAMWDSIDFGDTFTVFAGATSLYSGPFANYFTPSGQCEGPGTRLTPDFIDFGTPNYGQNAGFRDCARNVSFTFAHSGPTLVLSWAYPNSQGTTDESFGIDNVVVKINSAASVVPEPSTYLLMLAGLGGLVLVRRQRQA